MRPRSRVGRGLLFPDGLTQVSNGREGASTSWFAPLGLCALLASRLLMRGKGMRYRTCELLPGEGNEPRAGGNPRVRGGGECPWPFVRGMIWRLSLSDSLASGVAARIAPHL